MPGAGGHALIATLGGEVYVKSDRTHRRFTARLRDNIVDAVTRSRLAAEGAPLDRGRLMIRTDDVEPVAETVSRIFGIHRVEHGVPVTGASLDALAGAVADRARPLVEDRRFAVRVRRSGSQDWGSMDAAREIGTLLRDGSAGVDLDDPAGEGRVERD
jgi:tRNA uracil 4-sulfurtransferase